jgi:DMSO/TMAO reductase YedYZ molybdopterin-dependent catalytic subunit
MTRKRENLWAALVGVLSALTTLAAAEVIALIVSAASSPLLAVGSFVIDLVPGWVKSVVIALFGTGDKVALLVALGILVLLLAVAVGIVEYRRPPFGAALLGVIGAVATLAAITRADATIMWAIPAVGGTIVGIVVLRTALERLHSWTDAARAGTSNKRDAQRGSVTRRSFVLMTGVTAAVAVALGLGARAINATTTAVNAVREALTLPKPATAAAAIPAGAELGIPGLAPIISANGTFYRIDTALTVPSIDASSWKMKISGMVENPIEIGFDELLALPLTEHTVTLMCVSNEVGGTLVGNATWLGYPIRELLKKAKPTSGADMVLSRSYDGFTASTPLSVLQEEDRASLLAVGMNGEPLPLEHGFPVRMVVPGLYGYVSATKWVVELEVTTFAQTASYWTQRGWSDHGPVKTSSRIDVPASGTRVPVGTVAVAGVAWAQHTGIDRVEVRVDGGDWTMARLADAISIDTWRQWVYQWEATSGNHTVEVRATDSSGKTQSGTRVDVIPNGSEGWHSITVNVG